MKKVLALLGALTLGLMLLAGCGGGNACEDACEKLVGCAKSLSCEGLDPAEKMGCELVKSTLGAANCSEGSNAACDGEAKVAADKINSCTLDPKNCSCPQ